MASAAPPPYSAEAPDYLKSSQTYPVQTHTPAPGFVQPEYGFTGPPGNFQSAPYPSNQYHQPPVQYQPTGQYNAAYQVNPVSSDRIVFATPVVRAVAFGPDPQLVSCHICRERVVTNVVNEIPLRTHLIAAILCIIGCIPCCLIPYCMSSCQEQKHYCPNCNALLGEYNS